MSSPKTKSSPTNFCCGNCGDPFVKVQFFKLPCSVHYACSKEHQDGGCSICVCDYCDQQIEANPLCAPCGDIYHPSCFAKHVGADKFNKECAFCDEEIHTSSGSSDPSKISSIFISKLTKKSPCAPLSHRKLERLARRSWTADTISRKSRYTMESFVSSDITYSQLVQFGFSLRHLKEKGFDFNTTFLQYVKSGQMKSSEIKEVIEYFKPGFRQLMVTTGFIIEVDESRRPGEVLHYIKETFGLSVGDLYRLGLKNRAELIELCPLVEWQRLYPKKEVTTYIVPIFQEQNSLSSVIPLDSSVLHGQGQQKNHGTKDGRTSSRRGRDEGYGGSYPMLTPPAKGAMTPKTTSWM